MSGKIEISRELAEQALRFLMSPGDGWEAGQIAQELRAILAAPVVERQEPVALITVTEIDREYPSPGRNVYVTWLNDSDKTLSTGDKLYAEQPAPVAVVLPERKHVPDFTLHPMLNKEHSGWNACLDKVKELNQ